MKNLMRNDLKTDKSFIVGVCVCVAAAHAGVLFLANNISSLSSNLHITPPSIMEMVSLDSPTTDLLDAGGPALPDSSTQKTIQQPIKTARIKPVEQKQKTQEAIQTKATSQNKISDPIEKKIQPITTPKIESVTTTHSETANDVTSKTATANTSGKTSSITQVASNSKSSDTNGLSMGSGSAGGKSLASSSSAEGGKEGSAVAGSGNGGNGTTAGASINKGQIRSIEKIYPNDAYEAGIEGVVRLKVFVSASGKATNVKVLSSSHRLLANAARDGAKRAKYAPAMNGGKAIDGGEVSFSVTYRLNG